MKNNAKSLNNPTKEIFDYIIVGTGIAGLMTALSADPKHNILLITKSHLTNCATNLAQGGIAASISPKDSPKQHIQDTITAGHEKNDRKAVNLIIRNGPNAINKLEKLGVYFDKSKSGLKLHLEGAHSHPRIVHVKDHTGSAIEEILSEQIKTKQNITILENTFTKRLLVKNKICYGVETISQLPSFRKLTPKYLSKIYLAHRTVLATGGVGQVYSKTTNPSVSTGDGIAMAFKAGCKLKDMEYVQFHPTALNQTENPLFLLTEALRGAGAQIVNKKYERILNNIHPSKELAPRDIISKALFQEKHIYLDLRPIGSNQIKTEFPSIYRKLLSYNLDCTKRLIPITPAAHYLCGGVQTNLNGETSVKNLFAVGEVAYTGLHGANRLASNSLLEAVVMSNQIVKAPPIPQNSNHPRNNNATAYPKFKTTFLPKSKGLSPISIHKTKKLIQKIMWNYAGLDDSLQNLRQAKQKITKLNKQLIPPTNIKEYELRNLLTTALIIIDAKINYRSSSHL